MKKLKYLIYAMIFLCVVSCNKELEVEDPQLDITLSTAIVKAGEAVIFTIGNENPPDNLVFFSGEPNKEYAYSYGVGPGRLALNQSGYDFSFQSRFDYNSPSADSATKYGLQTGQLSIWASTDFNGSLDSVSVKKATWMDITSKFTLPTAQHASTFTNSGVNTLRDVMVKGKPLYIAYKLITKKQRDFGYSQFWNIQNFTIKGIDSVVGQLPSLYNMGKMEFNFVDITRAVRTSTLSRTAALLRMGGPNPYITRTEQQDSIINALGLVVDPELSEAWVISANISTDSVFLGYDAPVTVAGYTDIRFPTQYIYVYNAPGTYKAVFVGENRTADQTKQVVREFIITVLPK